MEQDIFVYIIAGGCALLLVRSLFFGSRRRKKPTDTPSVDGFTCQEGKSSACDSCPFRKPS